MHTVLALVYAERHTTHQYKGQAHAVQVGECACLELGLRVLELPTGSAPRVDWFLGEEDGLGHLHHRHLRGV